MPTNEEFQTAVPSELSELSAGQRQKVLANGVHLCTLFAWNLYVESHCVRQDQLIGYVPTSRFQERSDDSVDSEREEE